MKHIGRHILEKQRQLKITERGELMRHFCTQLNKGRARDGLTLITMSRMGKMLEGIPTKDLYYIKRVCDDAPNFSKRFWYVLNPDKYAGKSFKQK